MSDNSQKENPEGLALRARPRPVSRLNRRSLMILIAGAAVIGLGACLWAFRKHQPTTVPNSPELRSPQTVPKAEGLKTLPRDYDSWRPIPKLGPPAGELGRPVLHAEQNAAIELPETTSFRPNPEEDAERAARLRQHDEAEAAAKAQVFFQISHSANPAPGIDGQHEAVSSGDTGTANSAAVPSNESGEGPDRDQLHKASFVEGSQIQRSTLPASCSDLDRRTRSWREPS